MRIKFSTFLLLLAISNNCLAKDYYFVSINHLIEQEVGRIVIPKIYENMGLSVSIEPMPGKRAQSLATSGEKDGEIMRIYTYGIENPTTIRVPTAYYYLETMAFIRKDSGVVINHESDLRKYQVAKVRGVKHTNNITQGMKNVISLNNTEQIMKFLKVGRADVVLTNTLDGMVVINRLGYENIIPLDKPLAVLELYNYIHEKNKALIPKVDSMIKVMKANGELQEIIDRAEELVLNEMKH